MRGLWLCAGGLFGFARLDHAFGTGPFGAWIWLAAFCFYITWLAVFTKVRTRIARFCLRFRP